MSIQVDADTKNYPPSGGGWLVEAGKAVETVAVGVTVAFDNDGSVYDNLNRTVDYFLR